MSTDPPPTGTPTNEAEEGLVLLTVPLYPMYYEYLVTLAAECSTEGIPCSPEIMAASLLGLALDEVLTNQINKHIREAE